MDVPDCSVDRPRWSLVVDNESVRRVRAMFRDLPESQQSGFLELTAAIPPVLLGCSSAGKLAFMRFEDVMMHRGAVPLASLAEAARRACGEEVSLASSQPAKDDCCPLSARLGREWSDAAVRAWSDRFEELSCELGAKPSMRVCVS